MSSSEVYRAIKERYQGSRAEAQLVPPVHSMLWSVEPCVKAVIPGMVSGLCEYGVLGERQHFFFWNLLHNCIVDDVASFWNRCIWYKWRIWCMRMQWMTMVLNLMMTQFLPDVREWFSNNGHLCVTFDFMSAPVQKGVWKYTICCDLELIGCHDGIDNSGFSLLCVVTCMDVACYVGFKIFLHGELGWWIFGRSCMSEELWSFLWRSQTCFWDWFFSEFFSWAGSGAFRACACCILKAQQCRVSKTETRSHYTLPCWVCGWQDSLPRRRVLGFCLVVSVAFANNAVRTLCRNFWW